MVASVSGHEHGGPPGLRSVLARHHDFRRLFTGNSISLLGSSVTTVALPLTAVVQLHASPAQMGYLGAATLLPHLVLGLPAGVWVDRMPYRRVLVIADLVRVPLLAAIPVLAMAGWLRMWQLYVVAAAVGVGGLFESVAAQSFIPRLVPRRQLLPANSVLMLSNATVATTGSASGGMIVALLGGPAALFVDALSFLAAGIWKARIRDSGAVSAPPRERRLWRDVLEGTRAVLGHDIIRAVTVAATVGALAGQLQAVVMVLYLVRDLGLSSGLIGVVIAVGGAAGILGAALASPITRRLGPGPTFIAGMFLSSVSGVTIAMADRPRHFVWVLAVLVAGQILYGVGPSLFGVNQQTFRQALIAPELLSRANATWRFLIYGMQPLGALLGGMLATMLSLQGTLMAGSALMLAGTGIAALSPLRSLRELP